MKKTNDTEAKIIGAVKQLEAGRAVKEVAREMGATDQLLTLPLGFRMRRGNGEMAAGMSVASLNL